MNTHTQKPNAGMALVTALLFVSVAAMMVGSLLIRNIGQSQQTERFAMYTQVMYGVESAVTVSKEEIEDREDGIVGMDDIPVAWADDNSFIWPDAESESIEWQQSRALPDLQYAAYANRWIGDGRDSNGDSIIDSELEEDNFTIYAMAKMDDTVRRVEAVYDGGDMSVWDNAIFAGAGQAGGLINGNVSVHGGVHLLGNELPEGETAIAAIELSGTSLIHNNYDGLDPDLAVRVPALSETTFAGESVTYLDASLYIKNGLAGLSGSSEIGQPQELGNSFKETMEGTFVTDGWTGNAVVDDGDRGDPLSVWSDNGWDEKYNLGNNIPFPHLSDDWLESDGITKITDPDTGDWYSHEDYFSEVLLADPNNPTDGIYTGDITLNVAGDSFYWNATQGVEATGAAADAAVPLPGDDFIKFTVVGNEAILTMDGQIRIDGNLSFVGQGNSRTINYSGRAALLAYGDIEIDANLLTCNNGVIADTANSFPVNNILGLMASNDMFVGTTAQLQIMGAFYAQNRMVSAKQTTIMGTFVSNYFDMGTNVPDIYQVPAASRNLPYGMVGDWPIFVMQLISWKEM